MGLLQYLGVMAEEDKTPDKEKCPGCVNLRYHRGEGTYCIFGGIVPGVPREKKVNCYQKHSGDEPWWTRPHRVPGFENYVPPKPKQ